MKLFEISANQSIICLAAILISNETKITYNVEDHPFLHKFDSICSNDFWEKH
jgi:hypothetical protein